MKTRQEKRALLMLSVLAIFAAHLSTAVSQSSQDSRFILKYTEAVSTKPISGRALLLLSPDTLVDPDLPSPMNPCITIGCDFKNWKPGEELAVRSENSDGFMSTVADLDGFYSLRVILDLDTTSTNLQQAGICYGDKAVIRVEKGKSSQIPAWVNQVYPAKMFKESPGVKLLKVPSKLLSDFNGFPAFIEAAVVLPPSYSTDPEKKYPTVYVFPGWGTTHVQVSLNTFQQKRYGMTGYGEDKIYVVMNQDCRLGYHVFANSDNNGPRATSFIEEFIPAYESAYRALSEPTARFMVGQSSGAWASLWLLVNYPGHFAMAWAGSPDPVDFRDFIGHNLYARDANIFYDGSGKLTPALRSDKNSFTNKEWSDLETAMGEGGQYGSFEAVFGKRGKDGNPEQLFDRKTGRVSAKALQNWKKYDINRFIIQNRKSLSEKLDGKVNIVVASDDSFYLNGAVELLGKTLAENGIKANIRILPSGGHNTWSEEIKKELHAIMDQRLKAGQ